MQTLLILAQYTVLALCIAAWVSRLRGRRSWRELLPGRKPPSSPVGASDIFATVVIWFVLQLIGLLLLPLWLGVLISEMTPDKLSPEQTLEANGWAGILQFVAMLASIAWLIQRHQRVGWLGHRSLLGSDLQVGLLGSLMIIPVVMLIQAVATNFIPYSHPTIDSLVKNFSGKAAAWAWIGAVAVAPITEEFFFRGIVQGWLQRVFDVDEPRENWLTGGPVSHGAQAPAPADNEFRFWIPILLASAAFAAVHAGQGPAPIPLFFLSLGIGYIFRKSGSLLPCVIVHLVLNSIAMTYLTLSGIFPELSQPETQPAAAYVFF